MLIQWLFPGHFLQTRHFPAELHQFSKSSPTYGQTSPINPLADNINKKMSIYSGFATRQQEQTYDSIVCDLIEVLQRRLIKFYAHQDADQHKFHAVLANIQKHLVKMEHSKYLEPKVSLLFRQIVSVTAAVAHVGEQLRISQIKRAPLEKGCLSFESEKLSDGLKNYSVGKIRRQITSQEDEASSQGQANPELQLIERKLKIAASTHFGRDFVNKGQLQRWGVRLEQQPVAIPQQVEKKRLQYVIRLSESRSHKRQKNKR